MSLCLTPLTSCHAQKKDIVDAAVREYVDAHRDEINAGIKSALNKLNGSGRSNHNSPFGAGC